MPIMKAGYGTDTGRGPSEVEGRRASDVFAASVTVFGLLALAAPLHGQQPEPCLTDAQGNRAPGQWCSGDVVAASRPETSGTQVVYSSEGLLLGTVIEGALCDARGSNVVDRAGNRYVASASGESRVMKYNIAGVFDSDYAVPASGRLTSIDLAVDQQTMFYATGDSAIRVFRVDGRPLDPWLFDAGVQHLADPVLDPTGTTNRFGSIALDSKPFDFAQGRQPARIQAFAVRILPPGDGSGGVLVSTTVGVLRVDLNGTTRRTFAIPGAARYAPFDLAPDAKSFWTATASAPNRLFNYDIPTGRVQRRRKLDLDGAAGLCVVHAYAAASTQPDCSIDPANALCQPLVDCSFDADRPQCVPSRNPIVGAIEDQENDEGDVVQPPQQLVRVVARNPGGGALTYDLKGVPTGLHFDPVTGVISGTISYRATEDIGSEVSVVTVRVADAANPTLLTDVQFRWTVHEKNAVPTVTVNMPLTIVTPVNVDITSPASLGAPVTFTTTDRDECDHAFYYLANGSQLPAGLSLNYEDPYGTGNNHRCPFGAPSSATITGTPTTLGTTVFTVIASDKKEPESIVPFTFVWTVTDQRVNHAPVCANATPSRSLLWPPNHQFEAVAIEGVTDPDPGDRVTLRITAVRQDEPTLGGGAARGKVDALGVGTPVAQVRAERSGRQGGRLYFIDFSAADERGAGCTGTVTVGVPQNQRQGSLPVDSLLRFDSTVPGVPQIQE